MLRVKRSAVAVVAALLLAAVPAIADHEPIETRQEVVDVDELAERLEELGKTGLGVLAVLPAVYGKGQACSTSDAGEVTCRPVQALEAVLIVYRAPRVEGG